MKIRFYFPIVRATELNMHFLKILQIKVVNSDSYPHFLKITICMKINVIIDLKWRKSISCSPISFSAIVDKVELVCWIT